MTHGTVPGPRTGQQLVDEYFLENRTRLLDIAALLDRSRQQASAQRLSGSALTRKLPLPVPSEGRFMEQPPGRASLSLKPAQQGGRLPHSLGTPHSGNATRTWCAPAWRVKRVPDAVSSGALPVPWNDGSHEQKGTPPGQNPTGSRVSAALCTCARACSKFATTVPHGTSVQPHRKPCPNRSGPVIRSPSPPLSSSWEDARWEEWEAVRG